MKRQERTWYTVRVDTSKISRLCTAGYQLPPQGKVSPIPLWERVTSNVAKPHSARDLERACYHSRTRRRAWPQARRVCPRRRAYRPRADFHRARHFLGDVERALLV